MRRFGVCFLLLALSGAPQVSAQEFTAAQILAKLDEKAKVFTSLQASIKNFGTNYGVVQAEPQSGKLIISRPKDTPRMFLDITEPRKMKVLIDKGKGTMYYPDDNTYRDTSVDSKSESLQYLLIGFGATAETINKGYKAEAKGREMIGNVNAVVLELTSTSKATEKYPFVKLWLDPQTWTPVQTRVGQSAKTYNDYKYSNVQLNRSIADSVFDLKMKRGATKQ
jgi:outer membrane lipoprotein-sorting protein